MLMYRHLHLRCAEILLMSHELRFALEILTEDDGSQIQLSERQLQAFLTCGDSLLLPRSCTPSQGYGTGCGSTEALVSDGTAPYRTAEYQCVRAGPVAGDLVPVTQRVLGGPKSRGLLSFIAT